MMNNKSKITLEYEGYIRKAKNNKDTSAMYNIGVMHCTGEIGEVDYKMGAEWFEKAANLGLKEAQYDLGFMYDQGQGVKQDFKKAMVLYMLAAKQGDALAQNNIAVLYEKGQGVPVNIAEAKKWYSKACSNGVWIACQSLKKIGAEEAAREMQAINHLKAIGDRGGFDGKSIKQIKKYLEEEGIEESFAVWKEVKNGYLGVAMGALDHQLYDFAQTAEEMQIIVNHCMDDDFSDFVTDALRCLESGKSKPPREVKNANIILEDNILETLDILDFELDLVESNLKSNQKSPDNSNSVSIAAMALQGMTVRFGESLKTDKNEIADSIHGKLEMVTADAYGNKNSSLVLKDVKSIRKTIKKAKKYHEKYVHNAFAAGGKNTGSTKATLSQLKTDLSQLNISIAGFDKNISSASNSRSKDVERLTSAISNLESKYNKLKKAYDEGRRVGRSAEKELLSIKDKISKAKGGLKKTKASHDLHISLEVQRIKEEKSKALELKKALEGQIEAYENKLDPFSSQ